MAQFLPSADAASTGAVAILPAAATEVAAAMQPPPCRHINVHIPAELLEMILLAAGEDWHFVFSMVCRRWRAVLSSWRSRGTRCSKLRTPYVVGLHTVQLAAWARDNGLPLTALTCAYAAKNGRLGVLQWARENGCPWDKWTCMYAAENGHLAVLQWARANGCPWNEGTCSSAALNGHLAVLQWARANGCP